MSPQHPFVFDYYILRSVLMMHACSVVATSLTIWARRATLCCRIGSDRPGALPGAVPRVPAHLPSCLSSHSIHRPHRRSGDGALDGGIVGIDGRFRGRRSGLLRGGRRWRRCRGGRAISLNTQRHSALDLYRPIGLSGDGWADRRHLVDAAAAQRPPEVQVPSTPSRCSREWVM